MAIRTDAVLSTEAAVIKTETATNANTATRVGSMVEDLSDSKINVDKIGLTIEATANKSNDTALASNSTTEYPSVHAAKLFAEGLVVGLLSDRGNYNASVNVFPTTGGRGVGGLPLKGDLWYISVNGTLGGVGVTIGYSIRALIDTPGQTLANWGILNVGLGFVPENVVNKSTDIAADTGSNTKYPSVAAVESAIAAAPSVFPYKLFAFLFNQEATNDPVPTILYNTLGGTPVFTRIGAGYYNITLAGEFPANKTVIEGHAIDASVGLAVIPKISLFAGTTSQGTMSFMRSGAPNSEILITILSVSTGANVDYSTLTSNQGPLIYVEIKVYP